MRALRELGNLPERPPSKNKVAPKRQPRVPSLRLEAARHPVSPAKQSPPKRSSSRSPPPRRVASTSPPDPVAPTARVAPVVAPETLTFANFAPSSREDAAEVLDLALGIAQSLEGPPSPVPAAARDLRAGAPPLAGVRVLPAASLPGSAPAPREARPHGSGGTPTGGKALDEVRADVSALLAARVSPRRVDGVEQQVTHLAAAVEELRARLAASEKSAAVAREAAERHAKREMELEAVVADLEEHNRSLRSADEETKAAAARATASATVTAAAADAARSDLRWELQQSEQARIGLQSELHREQARASSAEALAARLQQDVGRAHRGEQQAYDQLRRLQAAAEHQHRGLEKQLEVLNAENLEMRGREGHATAAAAVLTELLALARQAESPDADFVTRLWPACESIGLQLHDIQCAGWAVGPWLDLCGESAALWKRLADEMSRVQHATSSARSSGSA